MKNRDNRESMRMIADHYGLSAPLSPEVRERMAGDYGRIYNEIMKKTSGTALFTSVVVWIFFLLKKSGIPVSAAKFAAASLIIASAGTGVYISMHKPDIVMEPPVPAVKYTVMIRPFASSSLDQKAGAAIADSLRDAIDKKYGDGFSKLAAGTGMGDTRWTVFGTVEYVKSSTVIIIKVVDAETSRTVFMSEEKCAAPDQCRAAAARLAGKFSFGKRK